MLEELRNQIIQASQAYYGTGDPLMTDSEFDNLLLQLSKLSPNDPLLTAIGHGYCVDLDESGAKFNHEYRQVGSLLKVHLSDWWVHKIFSTNKIKCISSKLDGSSVVCYYRNGLLYRAMTRGDNGMIGVDVTSKLINIVPNKIPSLATIAVRGEIVMKLEIFNTYYPEAASARNSANGILKSINPTLEDIKRLTFKAYNAYNDNPYFNTKTEMIEWIKSNGFDSIDYQKAIITDALPKDNLEKLKGILDNDYLSDGLVITEDDDPQNEIAYKFEHEKANPKVKSVNYGLSRLGNMIPVVYYDSVKLSGATLENASAYNAKYILDNSIGVGAEIMIQRSGEVIPYIVSVIKTADDPILPTNCPSCNEKLQWVGVHLSCLNVDCSSKLRGSLYVWYSHILTVLGLSNGVLEKFFDITKWKSVEDLYKATNDEWDSFLGQFPPNSHAINLLKKLRGRLNEAINPAIFIAAFGLQAVGFSTSERINETIGLDTYFSDENSPTGLDKIQRITTPAILNLILNYKYMKKIYNSVVQSPGFQKVMVTKDIKFKIAITGKLSKSRNLLAEEFLQHGILVSDIKKDVKYLVTDDPNSGSSKNKAAKDLGIMVINEADFRRKELGVE